MQILLFGSLKEKLQAEMINLNFSGTVQALELEMHKQFPLLSGQRYSIAVNQKIVSDGEQQLSESDQVALLPPFSGG